MSGKVYTKGGDKGKTSLIGGSRVLKSDIRVETYGSIDELKSFVGHLHDLTNDKDIKSQLYKIQVLLFNAESLIAAQPDYKHADKLKPITDSDIKGIEEQIDFMQEKLPALNSFILPCGDSLVSLSHVCRTVCRRAERSAVRLAQTSEVSENVLILLNRLSDYFFVLARYFAFINGIKDIELKY